MIIMKRRLILILIGFILVGCVFSPEQTNIFENPACLPPCWENITPGVTKKADALAILSKNHAIDQPIKDPNQALIGFDDAFHFTFYKDINRLGFIYIVGDRVSMIKFENKLHITLQKAFELFGVPQSVIVVEHVGEFDTITWLNPENGIVFSYLFHLNNSFEIRPGDEIDEVFLFDPSQYQLYLNNGFFTYAEISSDEISKKMRLWKGYGSITQYLTSPLP